MPTSHDLTTMKPIDITEPPGFYTYRNGEPARILCTDAPGEHPVRSLARDGSTFSHYANGSVGGPTNAMDLIESRPEPREWEVLVQPHQEIITGCIATFTPTPEGMERVRVREIPPTVATTESSPVSSSLTYPPPESEWPEKPDAGEGMVWERCPRGWKNDEKVKWITRRPEMNRWFENSEKATCSDVDGFITFRAVPEPTVQPEFPPVGWDERFIDWLKKSYDGKTSKELRAEFESLGVVFEDAPPLSEPASDPEESRAKAALITPEWLWYGRGPLKVIARDGARKDVMGRSITINSLWEFGGLDGSSSDNFYALRAGSPIAIANGLEPSPEWRELGEDDYNEVITKDHEVSHVEGNHGWIKPCVSIGKRFGDEVARFTNTSPIRARRKVSTEAVKRWYPISTGNDTCEMREIKTGAFILYTDHLAALKQAGKGEGQ